jgi:hypothetical protein
MRALLQLKNIVILHRIVGLSENKKISILQKKKKNCAWGRGLLYNRNGVSITVKNIEHPQGHKLKSGRKKGKGEN